MVACHFYHNASGQTTCWPAGSLNPALQSCAPLAASLSSFSPTPLKLQLLEGIEVYCKHPN